MNAVDENTACEEIFCNLNTNKVELTEKDLVKGLLLTSIGRENEKANPLYREILEIRALIGRQWDEIDRWTNTPEISDFFFAGQGRGSAKLLYLLACSKPGFSREEGKNRLYYYYESLLKKDGKLASDCFHEYRELRDVLNEWFLNDEIYNHLGFVLFAKKSSHNIIEFLNIIHEDRQKLMEELETKRDKIIDISNINGLDYKINSEEIHNLLLAIDVFCYKNSRFDYYRFNNERWSLEHIFPQTPEELNKEIGIEDIKLLNELISQDKWDNAGELQGKFDDDFDVTESAKKLKQKLGGTTTFAVSENERKLLYKLMKTSALHNIGNMALLTGGQNSSNSNGAFDAKRLNISRMVMDGQFVPRHTYDVFSKLYLQETSQNLCAWSEKDIDSHRTAIVCHIETLKGKKINE
jgi:hypothetical protein